MFERFTDRARRVVVLAQEEARSLKHNYIGTEHILLGLARESQGSASRALAALGIERDAVRSQVEQIVGIGSGELASGHIPFTPRAKKVLELSLREAMQLGNDYIGTEHILLGLVREGHGVAAQIMQRLGAELHVVRQQVMKVVQGEGAAQRPAARSASARPVSATRPVTSARAQRMMLSGFRAQLAAMESRLEELEKRVGTGPDHSDLDAEIVRVRGERQAAAEAQEYESAAGLRDRERELLADRATRQRQWSAAHPTLPELAQAVRELGAEVRHLGGLVGDTGGGTAHAAELGDIGAAAGGAQSVEAVEVAGAAQSVEAVEVAGGAQSVEAAEVAGAAQVADVVPVANGDRTADGAAQPPGSAQSNGADHAAGGGV